MGCYGIGVSRVISAIIEQHNDEKGIILAKRSSSIPSSFSLCWCEKQEQLELSEKLYADLTSAGYQVLYDDRAERAGVKFNDADLIGIPLQVVVGKKATEGIVEVKERKTLEKVDTSITEVLSKVEQFYK